MADMDDQTTLRLRVVYEANQAIGQAISEIRRLKEETGGLSAENQKTLIQLEYQRTLLDGAGSSLDHYTELVHEEALAQRAIRQALEESEPVHKALETRVQSTATAHGSMGRGVLQASYAVQDFTSVLSGGGGLSRALGSVQNNIPVLLTGLGVGAGLAGTISLVSVGLGAVIPLLGAFADGQDKAAEATKKHAEEAEKLKGTLTTEEEQIKRAVEGYTKDANNKVVGQAIEAAYAQEARHQPIGDEELGPVLAAQPATFGEAPGAREARARAIVIKNREAKAKEDANRLFSTLSTDPSSRAEAARLADSHAGFPAGFAGAMRSPLTATPDALFTQAVDQYDDVMSGVEESDKRKKEAKAEKKRKDAELKHQAEQRFQEEQRIEREQEQKKRQEQAETKHQAEQRFAEEQRIEREQKQAQEKAAREATKAAHEADPRIANRREIQADQSQALNLVNQNTHGFTPEIQRQIAHHLQSNHQAGLDMSATFAQALDYAIRQTREDIQRGIASGMRRQHQTSQSFYQP